MSFQPWKQAFNNIPNQFARNNSKSDNSNELSPTTTATFGKMKNGDVEISGPPQQSNLSFTTHPFEMAMSGDYSSSSTGQIETDPQKHSHHQQQQNGTKFSIFSQILTLNKINAFDNLLLNASLIFDDDEMNGDIRQGIRKMMEQAISDDAKQQIAFILEKISMLRPAEKLLLYLKMPGGHSEVDPLKQSQNPLGSRSEISHTINWVRSHLEQDDKVSIPKQEVYEDYVTFCGKINIKPLSTADFGKVMKQVFPDIRPRRLGTRGHSRYCYAAMRKATKLNPPHLPDLSSTPSTSSSTARNSSNGSNGCGSHGGGEDDKDEMSWNVIKNWSENLLGAHFDSIDDLASHIKQNNQMTMSSSTTTSKQMLQKKLMQREMKERKRNNNQPQTIKRRRKKRRLSTTSSPEHTLDFYANQNIQIKQEKETDGSAVENNAEHSENSSDVPMNLSNVRNSEQVTTTTISATSPNDAKSILKNKLINVAVPQISPVIQPTVIDSKPEEHQFIYCKKVRQAQQMKMSANLNSTVVSNQYQNITPVAITPVAESTVRNPPDRKALLKKKLAEARSQQGESNDLGLKKDDDLPPLKEDFILPRERFISICNMDRNALDTYLNNSEENSQDLELLQYFDDDKNKTNNEDSIEEDLGPATTSVPLLENYQLNFNDSKSDKQEKINQLRTILEEKHSSSSAGIANESPAIKSLLLKDQSQMSLTESPLVQNPYTTPMQKHDQNLSQNYSVIDDDKVIPQSPNTRRKNFSFVPINTQSRVVKNVNLMPAFASNNNNNNMRNDSFVSPRVTAINDRRLQQQQQLINIRSPGSMSLEVSSKSQINSAIPTLGVNTNTAFCRPSQFKMEPLSAPPSPSMAPHFNFSPQAQHPQQQQQIHSQNQFQFQTLTTAQVQGTNNNNNNYNYPVESRSQSVPPHHTNNMFNTYANYSQSACNSVAHTPVPSDYQEFTSDTTNLLDIFNNDQQPPLSSNEIKMETNDDVINDLLDNELLNQNSNTSDSTSDMIMRQNNNNNNNNNFNSRSVPTSPYQHHQGNGYNNGMSGNFCSLGKSVPNTPITSNPFRYSPELQRTRDFLINGFNNNINHNNNVVGKIINKSDNIVATIHHHAQQHHHENDIDVLDPSNLLGNM